MKKYFIALCFLMTACAPVVPTCTMTWTCGNQYCANAQGAWSGNGSFSGANAESDCLVWETAFLNSYGYPYDSVTSCSCNN